MSMDRLIFEEEQNRQSLEDNVYLEDKDGWWYFRTYVEGKEFHCGPFPSKLNAIDGLKKWRRMEYGN